MIDTPKVDWLALSPTIALLAVATLTLLGGVFYPRHSVRTFSVVVSFGGFVASAVLSGIVFDRSADGTAMIAESMTRDRFGAAAALLIAASGAAVVLLSAGDGRRDHVGEYYALVAASAAGMVFFVSSGNLMTMFLALEWFSIALYVLCALDTHRRASLEAGLKYLIVGSFGSAILLFGSAFVFGATGAIDFAGIAAGTDEAERLDELRELLGEPGVVAVGEAGLDYHYGADRAAEQRELFAAQLALARERELPVVVHTRAADADTEALLRGHDGTVVMHCFSEPGLLDAALERGWYVSFAGNVTYPKAEDLRAAAAAVPAGRILAETDAPYLAPQAVRGRRNEPAFVRHTVAALAEARDEDADELAARIDANATAAFRLPT